MFAWLRDGVRVYDQSVVCRPSQAARATSGSVSLLHGAAYLGVLLLVTLLVSALRPSGAATSPDPGLRRMSGAGRWGVAPGVQWPA